jgi:hypothetical protein
LNQLADAFLQSLGKRTIQITARISVIVSLKSYLKKARCILIRDVCCLRGIGISHEDEIFQLGCDFLGIG